MIYYETKTKFLIFKSRKDNFTDYKCTVLGKQKILYCKEHKYLGHIYHDDLSDDDDFWRQTRSIYARGRNAIVNKFLHSSNEVKYNYLRRIFAICILAIYDVIIKLQRCIYQICLITMYSENSLILIEYVVYQLNKRKDRSNHFRMLYKII